jgi:hypothetical protein
MQDTTTPKPGTTLKREVAIGSGLLAFGLLALPLAIYGVGQWLIGDYGDDASMLALAETIWRDFFALRPAAVLLVLSPYVAVQLLRIVRRVWRRREL